MRVYTAHRDAILFAKDAGCHNPRRFLQNFLVVLSSHLQTAIMIHWWFYPLEDWQVGAPGESAQIVIIITIIIIIITFIIIIIIIILVLILIIIIIVIIIITVFIIIIIITITIIININTITNIVIQCLFTPPTRFGVSCRVNFYFKSGDTGKNNDDVRLWFSKPLDDKLHRYHGVLLTHERLNNTISTYVWNREVLAL